MAPGQAAPRPSRGDPVPGRAVRRRSPAAGFRRLFEAHPQPILVVALETLAVLDVNEAAVRHYGYSRDEFRAMTMRAIHRPQDVAALEGYIAATFRRRPAARVGEAATWQHRKKDGTLTQVEITWRRTRIRGRDASLAFVRDVTPQRGALDAALDAIIGMDTAGRVTEFNRAAQEIFGYSGRDAIGRPLAELIVPPALRERHRQGLARHLATGESRMIGRRIELVAMRADGTEFPVELTVTRTDLDGRPGFTGFVRDITERVRAEAATRRHTAQLQALAGISLRVNASSQVEEILEAVTAGAPELVGANRCVATLLPDGTRARAMRQVFLSDKCAAWRGHDEPATDEGISRLVCETNQPMRLTQAELEAHPAWRGFGNADGERAAPRGWLAVPLVGRGGRNLGLIQLSDKDEGEFTEADEAVLVQLARMAGVAVESAQLRQETEQRHREAELSADLLRCASASLDLDVVLQRTVEGARDVSGADRTAIALQDPESEALTFRYWAGDGQPPTDLRVEPGKGPGGEALLSGRPWRTDSGAETARIAEDHVDAVGRGEPVAVVTVPIRVEGRIAGLLRAERRTPRPFTDGDEAILARLADHAAIAIRNVRHFDSQRQLLEEVSRQHAESQALARVTQHMAASLDQQEVFQHIVEAARRVVHADLAWFAPYDQERGQATIVAASGAHTDRLLGTDVRRGTGTGGIVLETGKPFVTDDYSADPRISSPFAEIVAAEGYRAQVAMPVRAHGRLTGLLWVANRTARRFSADDVSLLSRLADQAAIALHRSRLYEDRTRAELALRARSRQQAALAEFGQWALASRDLDALLQEATELVSRTLGVEYCELLELLPGGRALRVRAGAGWREGCVGHATITAGADSQAGYTLQRTAPVVVENLTTETRFSTPPLLRDHGVVSGVSVIVGEPARPFGVLGAHSARPRQFSRDDVDFVQSVANVLAAATERARRESAAAGLAEVSHQLVATLDTREVSDRIVATSLRLLGGIRATLFGLEPTSGALVVVAAADARGPATWIGQRLESGEDAAEAAVRERQPVWSADLRADLRFALPGWAREVLDRGDHASVLAVPLIVRGAVAGALALVGVTGRTYGEEDVALLSHLAAQAGVALENARLYREATRRSEKLTLLHRASSAFGQLLEMRAVGQRVIETVEVLMPYRRASMWLVRESDGQLELLAHATAGLGPEAMEAELERVRGLVGARDGIVGWVAIHGEAVRTGNVSADPRYVEADPAIRSELCVPIRVGGRTIGSFNVESPEPDAFSEDDELVFTTLASQAAVAIANARLYEAAERRRRHAESLAEVARLLSTSLSLELTAQRIVDAVRALLGTQSSMLFQAGPDPEHLRILSISGDPGHVLEPGTLVRADTLFSGLAVTKRRTLTTPDVMTDLGFSTTPLGSARAVVAVPLIIQDRVIGALGAAARAGRVFASEEVELVERFADHAALALQNARLYERSEARRAAAEALARVSRAITASLNLQTILEMVVDHACHLLGTERAALALVEPAEPEALIRLCALRGMSPASVGGSGPAPWDQSGTIPTAIREQRPIQSADILNDPAISLSPEGRAAIEAEGYRAVLSVPLLAGDRTLGALAVHRDARGAFEPEDVELLLGLTAHAAIAIENARLYEDAERRRRESEVLADLSQTVGASLDLDTVLQRVADGARHLCRSDAACIGLRGTGSECVEVRFWNGSRFEDYLAIRVEPGKGVGGQVLLTGRAFRTADYAADPRITKDYLAIVEQEGVVASLAVPIRIGDRVEGLLYADHRSPRSFTDHDEASLLRLADHAAVAIQNAQLFAEVRRARERLQVLSWRLVEVQERERRLLARELHDEIGQSLTGLKLTLETSARMPDPDARRRGAEVLVEELLAKVRQLSLDLRPPMLDDFGLLPTLLWHVERYHAQTGVAVRVEHTGLERRFPGQIETACYRIVQEALTNVARHAGVREATLRLWANDEVVGAQVADRGAGFEPGAIAHTTSGLAGMRERARLLGGRLIVDSAPGAGTRVTLEFKLGEPSEPGLGEGS